MNEPISHSANVQNLDGGLLPCHLREALIALATVCDKGPPAWGDTLGEGAAGADQAFLALRLFRQMVDELDASFNSELCQRLNWYRGRIDELEPFIARP